MSSERRARGAHLRLGEARTPSSRSKNNRERLGKLQYKLYADGRHAVLIVLQATRWRRQGQHDPHVFTALNPQGCIVTSFKAPSAEELKHDYLWRIHQNVPTRGEVGVFNRSHYEDVLVVRVNKLVPKDAWSARYEQINDFERMLSDNGTHVVKFFLHISKDEQRKRFEERLDDPTKQWKFNADDLDAAQAMGRLPGGVRGRALPLQHGSPPGT